MKRRAVLALLIAVCSLAHAAELLAQTGVPIVAVLIHGIESAHTRRLEAFREGMRDRGYAEGRSYRIVVRWSENQVERLPVLARELLSLKPAVVVVAPVITAQAVQRESKAVPIVMASGAGAQRLGLIASLARPGGNVTGLTNQGDELAEKQFEFLREIAPRAKRVLVLSSGLGAAEVDLRAGSRNAAKAYGMTIIEAFSKTSMELALVAERCARERCEALVALLDPNLSNFRTEVVALAAQLRIPAVYPLLEFAEDGGLISYSADFRPLYHRAAHYVERILKGAKPSELPIERPTKFDLVVNLKTAKAVGLTIPQSLLLRADRVIE